MPKRTRWRLRLIWLGCGSTQAARRSSPSVQEAQSYPYTPAERAQVQATRARLVVGSPQTVRAKLCALASAADADEVMAMTMVHDHAARRRSYELLAEAFQG